MDFGIHFHLFNSALQYSLPRLLTVVGRPVKVCILGECLSHLILVPALHLLSQYQYHGSGVGDLLLALNRCVTLGELLNLSDFQRGNHPTHRCP